MWSRGYLYVYVGNRCLVNRVNGLVGILIST